MNIAYDSLTARLRSEILFGDLTPGDPIRQDAYAERLGVSRTPIRQALHQLAGEGLVSYDENRGARVAPIAAGDVRDLFDMRIALEPLVLTAALPHHDKLVWAEAEMALDRADTATSDTSVLVRENDAFHTAIYRPCGRRLMLDTVTRLTERGLRSEIVGLSIESRIARSAKEHRALLETCVARDAAEAMRVLREHLIGARDDALATLDD